MSLPDLPDLKEIFHDVDTHWHFWGRLAGDRNYPALSVAVETFRAIPDTAEPASFAKALASVDALLAHHETIHDALEDQSNDAETEDNRLYFIHEMKALDRMKETRQAMIALPPAGATPSAELEAMERYALLLGQEIGIAFESRDGAVVIDLAYAWTDPVEDEDIGERIVRLTDCLIACDIENWKDGAGTEGRLRISGTEPVWIDAVDRKEDWHLERNVDLEVLAEMTWNEASMDIDP